MSVIPYFIFYMLPLVTILFSMIFVCSWKNFCIILFACDVIKFCCCFVVVIWCKYVLFDS